MSLGNNVSKNSRFPVVGWSSPRRKACRAWRGNAAKTARASGDISALRPEIIRALNDIDYQGPLSVEWEDARMNREHGAREACEFTKRLDFTPANVQFDAAFSEG